MLINEAIDKDDSPYRAQFSSEYRRKLMALKIAKGKPINRILLELIDQEIERLKHDKS